MSFVKLKQNIKKIVLIVLNCAQHTKYMCYFRKIKIFYSVRIIFKFKFTAIMHSILYP